MENGRHDPEHPGHDPHGNVWDRARREYLSGVTAATVCQRYGMSLRSFRLHARAGGWRRIDHPECGIAPEDGEFHHDDAVSLADLADQAFLNLRRAIGAGRAGEAASWMRLFDKLADRARVEVLADLPDAPPPAPDPHSVQDAARLTFADDVETSSDFSPVEDDPDAGPEALHLLHPVFFESTVQPAAAGDALDSTVPDADPRQEPLAQGP
jgi:hypothetical protein